MSLVEYEPRAWIALQNPAVELANAIAGTDFVPDAMKRNPAAITAAILYGDEIGLGPMQSLAKISVIKGRPTVAAETQRGMILADGHDLWIEESTITRCTIAGRRKGSEQTSRITWTLDDAKRAGIAGKDSWRHYPRQMLLARASAELARAIFADVIGGMRATEELEGDEVIENGVVEQAPKGTSRRRQRAAISQPQTSASAPEQVEPEEPPLPGDGPLIADAEAGGAAAIEPRGVVGPQPDDVPVAAPLISQGQLDLLMLLFRERGFSSREHRLAWTRVNIGRNVESSKDLTSAEASTLIDALQMIGPHEAPS
jgi:hypothetical protein